MEINYTKEETLGLLQEYYKKLEGREVKASIKASKGCIGLYEDEGCVTTISVTEKMDIGGIQKDVVTYLSKEEVEKNLTALFELYGFKLNSVNFNDGLNSRWEGYGFEETEVKTAYFKGITLYVDKLKGKKLQKSY